jgi:hypothetical protein
MHCDFAIGCLIECLIGRASWFGMNSVCMQSAKTETLKGAIGAIG